MQNHKSWRNVGDIVVLSSLVSRKWAKFTVPRNIPLASFRYKSGVVFQANQVHVTSDFRFLTVMHNQTTIMYLLAQWISLYPCVLLLHSLGKENDLNFLICHFLHAFYLSVWIWSLRPYVEHYRHFLFLIYKQMCLNVTEFTTLTVVFGLSTIRWPCSKYSQCSTWLTCSASPLDLKYVPV